MKELKDENSVLQGENSLLKARLNELKREVGCLEFDGLAVVVCLVMSLPADLSSNR